MALARVTPMQRKAVVWVAEFDGGIPRNERGVWAVVLRRDGEVVERARGFMPGDIVNTSNSAELWAAIMAMRKIRERAVFGDSWQIRGDSQFTTRLLMREYRPHKTHICDLVATALSDKKVLSTKCLPLHPWAQWVPREMNGEADKLGRGVAKGERNVDEVLL